MSSGSSLTGGLVVAVLAAALILSGFGAAYALGLGSTQTSTTTFTTTSTAAASNSTYDLTLVISTANIFNSTVGDQPSYYVLGPDGLKSSAQIYLPAHTLIKLTIVNYDDGNASLVIPNDNVVSGTANGTIFVASDGNINSSQGPNGIRINGGQTLSTVPADEVAHTFTVPALNLNIPIPLSSTVVAYFTVSQSGTYVWFCETACGFGSSGTEGAMVAPGWMTGSLVAS